LGRKELQVLKVQQVRKAQPVRKEFKARMEHKALPVLKAHTAPREQQGKMVLQSTLLGQWPQLVAIRKQP